MRPVYLTVLTAAYALACALLCLNYLACYPVPGSVAKVMEVFCALLICLDAGILGRKLMKFFGPLPEDALARNVFCGSLGFGALALLMFFFGVAGLFRSLFLGAVCVALPLLFYRDTLAVGEDIRGLFRKRRVESPSLLHSLLVFAAVSAVLLTFLCCFAPPTYFDTLVYHLALPGIYAREGHLVSSPSNVYYDFPQNMEMLSTLGLMLYDEIVPNLISFSLFLLTLGGIFSLCGRFIEKKAALPAVALYAITPAVMLLSPSTYVECALALFTLMALYAYLIGEEQGSHGMLLLSGIFSGLAFGVKYTAATVPLAFNFLLLAGLIGKKDRASLKKLVLYNGAVLLVMAPWFLRNIAHTGNPVFPFLYNVFNSAKAGWAPERARDYFSSLNEYRHSGNLFLKLVRLPYDIVRDPVRFGGGFDILGNFGWAFAFLAVPPLFFMRQSKYTRILLYFAAFSFIVWFAACPVLRFLYPVLPVVSVLCAFALFSVISRKIFLLNYVLPFCAVLLACSNIFLYFFIQDSVGPFRAALGLEDKQQYLSENLRYSPYPAFTYINTNLGKNDAVLFVGEMRGFYCERTYLATPNDFVSWANGAGDASGLAAKLKNEGITHILYNRNEAKRLDALKALDGRGAANWLEFLRTARTVFNDASCSVVSLQ